MSPVGDSDPLALDSGGAEPGVVEEALELPGKFVTRILLFLEYLGGVIQLGLRTFRLAFKAPHDLGAIQDQVVRIGLDSMSVATLTAIFSSLVITVQFAVQLARFGAKDYVSSVVAISLVRELGPVLTALMVGGRVGAGIAAELGSMTVTEQVDAIRSMGADPVKKLVVPRVLAAIVVLPLLTIFADVLGVLGAMGIAQVAEGVNVTFFFNSVIEQVTVADVMGGLIKTLFFGLSISLIACYQGLATTNGTEGVGESTTRTVVITSVATLIGDFILTSILLSFGL
jgi:phospholipid/cholesterol/gamma-HCH transport system permease protein